MVAGFVSLVHWVEPGAGDERLLLFLEAWIGRPFCGFGNASRWGKVLFVKETILWFGTWSPVSSISMRILVRRGIEFL
ncbi:MAG: hypothetical protein CMN75_14530 [Spirochaeta sp.]|nr:hypothetical protein [Spirochaeta sp.]